MSGTDFITTPNLGLYKPFYDADDGMWGTHLNANADVLDAALGTGAGGLFLPVAGGTMDGTISFWGASSTINTYDAQLWATGGATTSGNPGHGELNFLAGRHIFQAYDGTTQFRVSNTPNAYEWWEAIGGSVGTAATLRAGSDLGPDCSGAIQIQGHGSLVIGNGEGKLLSLPSIGGPIINYLEVTNGLTNQGVTVKVAGGDGLRVDLGLVTNYNGGVSTGNSNGPLGVFRDPTTAGVPRTSWFNLTAGASGFTPTIGLAGATNETLAITASGTGRIWFQKGVGFGTAVAANAADLTTHIDLYNGTFGINYSGGAVNFNAATSGYYAFLVAGAAIGYVSATSITGSGQMQIGGLSGPTWTTGSGVPSSTQPVGSLYSRVTTWAAGATLYVSKGAGAWTAVASV